MTILLTGGSGFIGTNLLKELEKNHKNITLIGRKNHNKHKTFICDFIKDDIPEDAFNNIDTVYHLAGYTPELNRKISSNLYNKVNVKTVLKIAQISLNRKVKNFIFLSSVKAKNSLDIYGISKKQAEDGLLKLSKNSDMNIIVIRPALVYGGQVKGNLKLMIDGINKGWFPPLPETKNKKSMIHIDDLVSAILFLSNKSNLKHKIFIATDGNSYSSAEIYNTLCFVLGKVPPKWRIPKVFFSIISHIHPSIKFMVEKLFGNDFYSSENLQKLGFKPKKSLKDI